MPSWSQPLCSMSSMQSRLMLMTEAGQKIQSEATLQGNFNVRKLYGIYHLMMEIMIKTAGKALSDKKDRTPDMLLCGGERVKHENISSVLDWYKEQVQNK